MGLPESSPSGLQIALVAGLSPSQEQVRTGIRAKRLRRPGSDKRNGSYPVDATESDSATFAPTMRPKVFARNTDVAGGCLW